MLLEGDASPVAAGGPGLSFNFDIDGSGDLSDGQSCGSLSTPVFLIPPTVTG